MNTILHKIKMRIACVLTSIMLLVSPIQYPTIVYAAEPQFGSSTVTYTVDDYFYVQIPETINVGTEAEIIAMETNIAPEKSIYVRIEWYDGDGFVRLKNDNDPSRTIDVYFYDSNGERYTSSNNLIAQFRASDGNVQTATFNTKANANPMDDLAGSYSGQVYFSMICE